MVLSTEASPIGEVISLNCEYCFANRRSSPGVSRAGRSSGAAGTATILEWRCVLTAHRFGG